MKWAVAGASGHTGQECVKQLLGAGHEVTAIARKASSVLAPGRGLTTFDVDVRDAASVTAAVRGCERVISAVGIGASRETTTVYSAGVANLMSALKANAQARLIAVSAAPVGDRSKAALLDRAIVMPILDRMFKASYDDMRLMEASLSETDQHWVVLRPPRLLDKSATGKWRVQAGQPPKGARSLTFGDLAAALIQCIDEPALTHQYVYVAN